MCFVILELNGLFGRIELFEDFIEFLGRWIIGPRIIRIRGENLDFSGFTEVRSSEFYGIGRTRPWVIHERVKHIHLIAG